MFLRDFDVEDRFSAAWTTLGTDRSHILVAPTQQLPEERNISFFCPFCTTTLRLTADTLGSTVHSSNLESMCWRPRTQDPQAPRFAHTHDVRELRASYTSRARHAAAQAASASSTARRAGQMQLRHTERQDHRLKRSDITPTRVLHWTKQQFKREGNRTWGSSCPH